MTLESVYHLSQSVATVLLLVSIIFVGIQIRLNTKATRAASGYEVMKTWGLFNAEGATNPARIRLLADLADETKRIRDFTPSEQLEMHIFVLSLTQLWTSQYFLFKEGSLPKEYWELNGRFAGSFYRYPVVRDLFERHGAEWMTSPDFLSEVQSIADRDSANLSSLNFRQEKVETVTPQDDD